MSTTHRYVIPIDDKPHKVALQPGIISSHMEVVYEQEPYLEFWSPVMEETTVTEYTFQVYGTGHPIPDNAVYVGTAPRNMGLVFHLYMLD